MTRLARFRESFWFVPTVLTVLSAVLAELLVAIDTEYQVSLGPFDWMLYRAGADGGRDVLGVIAGTSMTVASTSFSITIAVLALTSSSYGPRLVRNFMADRANQTVLGVYVATFLYCLLVLRSIRADSVGEPGFVPRLSLTVAVLFAIGNVGVLIFFIHHISDSIQVWTLTSRVRGELHRVIDEIFPEPTAVRAGSGTTDADDASDSGDASDSSGSSDTNGSGGAEGSDPADPAGTTSADGWDPGRPGELVRSDEDGYIQSVDRKALVDAARGADAVVRLVVRPGSYVTEGEPVAVVQPPRAVESLRTRITDAVTVASARSPHQDVEFAARQLVEMAVRAISPGTNDPWTAVNALDELSSGLVRLARREPAGRVLRDTSDRPRLVLPEIDPQDVVDLVADSMRQYALGNPPVVEHTALLLGRVGTAARSLPLRARCVMHLELLDEAYRRAGAQPRDQERLAGVVHDQLQAVARAGVGALPPEGAVPEPADP